MTDKDKKLIEQAKRLHSTQWDVAYLLAEQADTETAREFIKSIGSLQKISGKAHDFSRGMKAPQCFF